MPDLLQDFCALFWRDPRQLERNAMNRMQVTRSDASSRVIWPPVIFSVATLASIALYWFANITFVPAIALWPARMLALTLCLSGASVALIAEISFKRAGTAVLPTRPTSRIVETGVYGWTRNPMYLGMSLFVAGLAFGLNSLWFLLALPVAVFAVTKLAIEPEEQYLADKFGQTYLSYKARVRRWF